jgi:hypothetical protein
MPACRHELLFGGNTKAMRRSGSAPGGKSQAWIGLGEEFW